MAKNYLDKFYARLCTSKDATHTEVRDAYHLAAKRLHPDTNDTPAATEMFLQVQEAYETLSNESKRTDNDLGLPEDIGTPPDVLSLVSCNDHAEVIIPANRGLDYSKIDSRIKMIQTKAGTKIFNGLEAGFFEKLKNSEKSNINHLILITDGRTFGDEAKSLALPKTLSKKVSPSHVYELDINGMLNSCWRKLLQKPWAVAYMLPILQRSLKFLTKSLSSFNSPIQTMVL